MDHFNSELTPEFAWKNDMLREARETNRLLSVLLKTLRPTAEDVKLKRSDKNESSSRTRPKR